MTRGSLYQIRMIVIVRELDVEEDHCIEYTNDHGSGNHGCGNRLLYQIQIMLLVATVDEERGS